MKRIEILKALAGIVILFAAVACSHSVKNGHDHENRETAEESHSEIIELSEKQMNAVGIELGTLSTMALGESVQAAGELSVDPGHMAEATPLMEGIIRSISVREGDFVEAGAPVASIEYFEINSIIRNYKEALSTLKLTEKEYERQKKLAQHGAGTARNLENATIEYESAKSIVGSFKSQMKSAGINIDRMEAGGKILGSVKSPIRGIVTEIYGRIGSEAGSSRPVLAVIDNSGVFATVRIYEKDLKKIRQGMPVEIALTNGPGILRGKVEEVVRAIDPETKTIDVRVGITKKDRSGLLPGMAVTAYIDTEGTEVIALPESAVVTIEGKDCIYMLAAKETHDGEMEYLFKPVEVIKGSTRNGFTEIKPVADLPIDALIVTSKAFYLASMASDHGSHSH